MNQLLKYTLLFFLMTFAACSSEDDAVPTVPNGQPQPGDALELIVSAADFVTDGAPDTRAADNGKETTFENGDRVGIIILDASYKPIYDNIPYKYVSNKQKWVFDSSDGKGECYYDTKAETYIVYYPYSRAADGVTNVDDLKAKFAPKFNQSDIKDYRSSDLMVWSRPGHLASSVTTLDAKLEHAFASVYLAPTAYTLEDGNDTKGNIKVSDVSLTIGDNVYVPYQTTDGSLRCIVPANINPSGIRCFYTFSGTTYGNTINISGVANTRYTSAPEIINKIYSLTDAKVGDFYCKNSNNKGYLIPSDVALTDEQKATCIGIVFLVGSETFNDDPLLKKYHFNCSHGLVVALQDAGVAMNWSRNFDYVQNWVNTAGNPYKNDVNVQETNEMRGYSNTLALMAYNEAMGAGNEYRVLPCDAILGYSSKNLAPKNSSGWYFPSIKELQFVCWGQGQSGGTAGRDYLNTQITVSGGSPFVSDCYWSSTEGSNHSSLAWYVNFDDGGVYGLNKPYRFFRVRPILAF